MAVRIIIADDSPTMLEELRALLQGLLYEIVAIAGSGEELLRAARRLNSDA
jgi:DNA-binding NarL/FixJ family response regulator